MKKIVIAGGTGFLGSALRKHFLKKNIQVVVLSRSSRNNSTNFKTVHWDGKNPDHWIDDLENADILINLCGKSVDCRYNSKNRKEILDSRVNSTKVLGEAITTLKKPPVLWINSSSATIYPHSETEYKTESHEVGKGFSVNVCKAWEGAFFSFITPQTRKVAIRSSMVFGNEGSVYKTLKDLSLRGLGGTQGSGKQYISWIHIVDFINAIDFIIKNNKINGCVNVCAPDPRPNREFNRLLRNSLGVKFHFPVKTWMVYLGAIFMKTEAELVLKSRKVIPKKLLDSGFTFEFPDLESAFNDLNRFG
ncbi:TIGR01777 family oxidoreductase [Xanthovirga aplysinae]|uniref:TIGR01777 family oxidoreductase n=1 Tax=Xanthovirga aplysinae TaxID=2529853 RepID=UPI0012BBB01D|nr:TIGR01777 family oxidoreductase [Xanthovirga aplysinae]MTI31334.1 TIGR01777 family protein [Xanthovirga aplysinae]